MEDDISFKEPCNYVLAKSLQEAKIEIPTTKYRGKYGQIRREKDFKHGMLTFPGDTGEFVKSPTTTELLNFLPVGTRLVKRERSYMAKWDALDGLTHHTGGGKTPADALASLVLDLALSGFYKLPRTL